MLSRRYVMLVLVVLVVLLAGAAYVWGTPRLLAAAPSSGAAEVPATAALRLTFSRRMQTESLVAHLALSPDVPGAFRWEGNTLVFQPDEPWPRGQTIQVTLAAGGRAAGLLPLPLRDGLAWSFTIGYPRLAYLYPSDGPANVYALNPYSGVYERLTDSSVGILEYDIDPSGAALYYSAKNGLGGSDIYRQALAGGDNRPPAERLVECLQAACRAPRVSPGGDYLAYELTGLLGSSHPAYTQVWLLPLVGAVAAPSAPGEPFLAGRDGHATLRPSWSPAGLLTYYDTNEAAYIFRNPAGGEVDRLAISTGEPGAWDPGGRFFVAPEISAIVAAAASPEANPDTQHTGSLIFYNLEDHTREDLTQSEDLEDIGPAFSPDGAYLAFARRYLELGQWTPGRQLWLLRLADRIAFPLTNDPYFHHHDFAWSPEGDRLAFVRFNQTVLAEPPEIWFIDPESTLAELLVTGGYAPEWIP